MRRISVPKGTRRTGSSTKTCRDLEPAENFTLQRVSSRKESHDFGQRSASVSSGADARHDDRGSERSDWASHTSCLSGKQDSAPSVTDNMEGPLLCGFDTPSTRTTRSKMRSTPIAQHYRLFWNHDGCGRPWRRTWPDDLRGPYDAPETHPQRPARRPDNGHSPWDQGPGDGGGGDGGGYPPNGDDPSWRPGGRPPRRPHDDDPDELF